MTKRKCQPAWRALLFGSRDDDIIPMHQYFRFPDCWMHSTFRKLSLFRCDNN